MAASETASVADTSPALAAWEVLKNAGNELYKAGDLPGAVAKYGEAIEAADATDEAKATLLSNRAQALLKTKEYERAAEDCTACLKLQPSNVKALFRRCAPLNGLPRRPRDASARTGR